MFFSVLFVIHEAFVPVDNVLRELEARSIRAMYMFLLVFKHLEHQLTEGGTCGRDYRTIYIPSFETRCLSKRPLSHLKEIVEFDMWIATSILHPDF